MHLSKLIIPIIFFFTFFSQAQSNFVLDKGVKSKKIRFELISNVIIIPVEVNGIKLKFLLDSGVSKPLVFNFLKDSDSLKILNSEKIKLKGLGDGEYIDALKSSHNTFKIGNAINTNQTFYAIYDSRVNFAPRLGIALDGIIGYDLFKDFVVEINYTNQYIRLHNPKYYKYKSCKKCDTFNLEFNNNKPYLNANVKIEDQQIPVKLLIDTGSSDAIWLFENASKGLKITKKYFKDYLGSGLSGDVFGKRTKIESLELNQFVLNQPKVAFPDSTTIVAVKKFKDRDGTIGAEVFRRFNSIVDYPNSMLTLKPNYFFKRHFSYNKSGLQIEHDGVRVVMEIDAKNETMFNINQRNTIKVNNVVAKSYNYIIKPSYVVYNINKNSPAYFAGLQKGDIIFEINGTSTHDMTLDNLIGYFFQKEGKKIKLKVYRAGITRYFEFVLKSPIE